MTFLPENFDVPAVLETERFRLRPITIQDVVKDHDAVVASRERLRDLFGEPSGWSSPDLTLRRGLLELARHEREFRGRSSFAYAVASPDERRLLGRVHVNPTARYGYDAEVRFWTRSDEPGTWLEDAVEEAVREWLVGEWPFRRVAFPGRDIPQDSWNAVSGRTVA